MFSVKSSLISKFCNLRVKITHPGKIIPAPKEIIDIVDEISVKVNFRFKGVFIIHSKNKKLATAYNCLRNLYITKELLEIVDQDELKAAIAHEMAHSIKKHFRRKCFLLIKSMSIVTLMLISILIILEKLVTTTIIPFVLLLMSLILLVLPGRMITTINRPLEIEADQEAVKIMKNPNPMVRLLAKIFVYNKAHRSSFLTKIGLKLFGSSHPAISERIKRISQLSDEEINKLYKWAKQAIIYMSNLKSY